MGATSSFPDSNLSHDEILRLSKRFKKLDTDKSGTLCLKELLDLPQIKQNPLARRIIGKLRTLYTRFESEIVNVF